jgi:hypothetical protein
MGNLDINVASSLGYVQLICFLGQDFPLLFPQEQKQNSAATTIAIMIKAI